MISKKLFTKMRYFDEDVYTDQGGNFFGSHVFRGNSIQKPDFTATGHRAYGFDEWSQFYERYRVLACKIEVWTFSVSASANTMGMTSIIASPTSTLPSFTIQNLFEDPRYKVKTLGNSAARPITYLRAYSKTTDVFGINKTAIWNEDYDSDVTTNPVREWFWHVFIEKDSASTPQKSFHVRLTYYVCWEQLKSTLPTSEIPVAVSKGL